MKQNKSSRDWSFRIRDILHAIEKIERFTTDMTFLEFKKNEVIIDAIIYNFAIIGEASNAIPRSIQNAHPQIQWRQIIGLRNVLIHEYYGIDLNAVWHTIHVYLPELKLQLQNIKTNFESY